MSVVTKRGAVLDFPSHGRPGDVLDEISADEYVFVSDLRIDRIDSAKVVDGAKVCFQVVGHRVVVRLWPAGGTGTSAS